MTLRIAQLYESYNRCLKHALESNLKGDHDMEMMWDDNARELLRQIAQLEEANHQLKAIKNDRDVIKRVIEYYETV